MALMSAPTPARSTPLQRSLVFFLLKLGFSTVNLDYKIWQQFLLVEFVRPFLQLFAHSLVYLSNKYLFRVPA